MIKEKISDFFNKNKNIQTLYIILIIGIVIILFANSCSGFTNKSQSLNKNNVINNSTKEVEKEIENILSKISGVGRVNVMITYEDMGQKHYVSDTTSENSNSTDKNLRTQTQTKQTRKLVTSSDEPIITRESYPKVMGVIVVCDGGVNLDVKENITNALKAVLDVADHKISVLPHK